MWALVGLQVQTADHLLLLQAYFVQEEVRHQVDSQLNLPALCGRLQHRADLPQKVIASDLIKELVLDNGSANQIPEIGGILGGLFNRLSLLIPNGDHLGPDLLEVGFLLLRLYMPDELVPPDGDALHPFRCF